MAIKLINAGCCTIEQMREEKYQKLMNPNVKLAVKHMDDMNTRITRAESEASLVSLALFALTWAW